MFQKNAYDFNKIFQFASWIVRPIVGNKGKPGVHWKMDDAHISIQGSDSYVQLPSTIVPNDQSTADYMEVYFYRAKVQLGNF